MTLTTAVISGLEMADPVASAFIPNAGKKWKSVRLRRMWVAAGGSSSEVCRAHNCRALSSHTCTCTCILVYLRLTATHTSGGSLPNKVTRGHCFNVHWHTVGKLLGTRENEAKEALEIGC